MRVHFVLSLLLLCTPLFSEETPLPPPAPPSFTLDEGLPAAPPVGDLSSPDGEQSLTNDKGWTTQDILKAEEADPQTKVDQALFNRDPAGDEDPDSPAAPSISDEQKIKNSMEVCYQLYHAEDFGGCAKCTKSILDVYPRRKLFWVRYVMALSLEHDGMHSEAIKQYALVTKNSGHSTYGNAALFRMGLNYAKINENLEAIYVLRDVIDTHPRSEYRLQAYVHLGNLYKREGDWKATERIYKELIRLYPNTMWAYTGAQYLAEAYAHQGKFKKAIRIYKNMQRVQSTPINFKAQAQLRIGDIYYTLEAWQKALEAYRRAVRDYEDVQGIPLYAEQKIELAEEGRRLHRQPYEVKKNRVQVKNRTPLDQGYQMKHIEEVYR